MSSRLKKDVLFINIDGMQDYYLNPSSINNNHSHYRLEYVKKIKNELLNYGCNVRILNPTDESDIKIPIFPIQSNFKKYDLNDELDYSIFTLKHLYNYIKNESFTHIIIFQYDGYPVNYNQWSDSFLDYDFIGRIYNNTEYLTESMFFSFEKKRKGIHLNGGFSIRSRQLLEKCSNIDILKFKEMFDLYQFDNEDMLLLDYVNWKNMPNNSNIINKFVSSTPNSDSFGFHEK